MMLLIAQLFSQPSWAETRSPYLSAWWQQSINVVGSYHTRFGPLLNNDVYVEYEAFTSQPWFDFYGYIDIPKTFAWGNGNDQGVWDRGGSPFFMELEPRLSLNQLTDTDGRIGPFKTWYIANDYIYDQGSDRDSRQNSWYMGLGTDVDTQTTWLPQLALNVYAKHQWANYRASNENHWDGYRFKVKYRAPLTTLWGGELNYIGFTNIDWGSSLHKHATTRTRGAVASSHVLALSYPHWHYGFVARYFHHGGQWADGTTLGINTDATRINSTGWGYYLLAGYRF